MKPVTSLVISIICFSFSPSADAVLSNNIHRSKRNEFTNNYGYGPFGIGPSNAGFDSFGFYKDKFYNSGLPAKYTFASYRNYYQEVVVPYGLENPTKKGFYENFNNYPTLLKHLNDKFEVLQQDRFGPYYNGVWGYADHSPDWYGRTNAKHKSLNPPKLNELKEELLSWIEKVRSKNKPVTGDLLKTFTKMPNLILLIVILLAVICFYTTEQLTTSTEKATTSRSSTAILVESETVLRDFINAINPAYLIILGCIIAALCAFELAFGGRKNSKVPPIPHVASKDYPYSVTTA